MICGTIVTSIEEVNGSKTIRPRSLNVQNHSGLELNLFDTSGILSWSLFDIMGASTSFEIPR